MRSASRVILGLWVFICAGAALAHGSRSSSHSSHSSGPGRATGHSGARAGVPSGRGGAIAQPSSGGSLTASAGPARALRPGETRFLDGGSGPSELASASRLGSAITKSMPELSTTAGSGNYVARSHSTSKPSSSGAAPGSKGTSSGNGSTTGHHSETYCSTCARDPHGKIARSEKAKEDFMRLTGFPHGRPGYVVDHIKPLECGGRDVPLNMQWQTKEAARAKDRTERKGCS